MILNCRFRAFQLRICSSCNFLILLDFGIHFGLLVSRQCRPFALAVFAVDHDTGRLGVSPCSELGFDHGSSHVREVELLH